MSDNPADQVRRQAAEQELSQAQGQAQATAHDKGPLVNLHDEDGSEILEKLAKLDIESDGYEGIEALLQPYLAQSQMLADHDDYYDSLSRELLNTNLAERHMYGRERGRLLTGPFLDVAMDVEHATDVETKPLSPSRKEALRSAFVDTRTDRQSLEGELLAALTEMHVSSEVHRHDDNEESSSNGGLLSMVPGLK